MARQAAKLVFINNKSSLTVKDAVTNRNLAVLCVFHHHFLMLLRPCYCKKRFAVSVVKVCYDSQRLTPEFKHHSKGACQGDNQKIDKRKCVSLNHQYERFKKILYAFANPVFLMQ